MMKNTQALITQSVNAIRSGEYAKPAGPSIGQTAAQHVNEIFKELMSACPAWRVTFTDAQILADTKKSYVKALMDAKISDFEMIKLGVSKARLDPSDFFPSPGKFVSWCKPSPEDLGLSPMDIAYREACNNAHIVFARQWSHPAVYQAGKETGWFKLRSEQQRYTRPEFKAVYADICERVMKGEVFEVPKPVENALEHHGNGEKVTTEQAKTAGKSEIAKMKAMFRRAV